jgi:hypothetical protein
MTETTEHEGVSAPKAILLPRGEAVGIGKFKIRKSAMLKLEIPQLSFVLIKESDTSFISTCIHLRTDGYGNTWEDAIFDMIDSACYLLEENFLNADKEKAWKSLEDWFLCDEWSSELWNAYHRVQIEIAKQGRSADNSDLLKQKIEELEQRMDELKSEESRLLKKKDLKKYKKVKSLQYRPIGEKVA